MTWRRAGRQLVALVGAAVVVSALGTGFLLLLGRDPSAAVGSAATAGVGCAVAAAAATLVVPGRERADRARGVVAGYLRAGPGAHPRVPDRWFGTEVRPVPGLLTVMPLHGPSAVPFDLEVRAATDAGRPPRGRPVLVGGLRVVELTTPSGVVELATSRGNVDWLLDAVDRGSARPQ
ncbi:hypothetical protein [Cellulomonas aerilata]|uniref:hypothetical protein n=1 Tax=Cellulomonas aerilata TaxID=515326 RepID=UPI0011BF27FF|nr:hypothetical protein [Cellulomonas aerilata]